MEYAGSRIKGPELEQSLGAASRGSLRGSRILVPLLTQFRHLQPTRRLLHLLKRRQFVGRGRDLQILELSGRHHDSALQRAHRLIVGLGRPQKPGTPMYTRPGQFAALLGLQHDPMYVYGDQYKPTQFTARPSLHHSVRASVVSFELLQQLTCLLAYFCLWIISD